VSGRVVGLDVGGTKIAAGWIEDDVFVLGDEQATRTDAGADGLLAQLVEMIGAARGPGIGGVGLGVPSVIEWTSGRVKSSVNIPLRDVPLRHELEERLDLPVFVDNDATVAALAEAHDGTRFTVRDLVMFTVGTGVGGGLVIGGRVFRGRTGAAGELGHMLVGLGLEEGVPPPAEHPPQPGSLESLAAGKVLDRLAHGQLGLSGREVVHRALAGDGEAAALVRLLGERLGIGIANAINTFDPEEVVIGGGLAAAGDVLLEPAARVAREYVLPGVGEETTIRLARHDDAGVRGAALLAARELEQGGAHG